MNTPMIQIHNLSKLYRLGTISANTLQESMKIWWYRRTGREQELMRIGQRRTMIEPDHPQAGPEPNTFWALRGVEFDVQEGEVFGIIGHNGAGKSTLLKILSRITEPTEGRVVLKGRTASLLEVGTGFHPELTGRENIYLNGAILGMRKAEIDRHFDEIVSFSEVERFIDTPVKRYSSGMYVRLAFAVAAHLSSEILIIDEVLAVGDASFQKKCLGKMDEVGHSGRTILFVSHNMNSVKSLCQKAVLIDHGQVRRISDDVEAVTEDYVNNVVAVTSDLDLTERVVSTDVKLKRVRLSGGVDNSGVEFAMGDTLLVDVDFTAQKWIDEFMTAVWVKTPDGTTVLHSMERKVDLTQMKDRDGRIRCRLDDIRLMPGRYHLSVWVGAHRDHSYDASYGRLVFDVEASGRYPLPDHANSSQSLAWANFDFEMVGESAGVVL